MPQGEEPTRGAGSVNIRRLATDDAPNIRICRRLRGRTCREAGLGDSDHARAFAALSCVADGPGARGTP